MKSYLQGMITGSVMVFATIVFMGQTKEKDDLYKKLENQINELYEVTRPKVENIVDSKVDEFIGSKQKCRFKIERLKLKKLDRNVILDTSSGSIYAIGKENESCRKIHWIN